MDSRVQVRRSCYVPSSGLWPGNLRNKTANSRIEIWLETVELDWRGILFRPYR